jgi:hypothetical protein
LLRCTKYANICFETLLWNQYGYSFKRINCGGLGAAIYEVVKAHFMKTPSKEKENVKVE